MVVCLRGRRAAQEVGRMASGVIKGSLAAPAPPTAVAAGASMQDQPLNDSSYHDVRIEIPSRFQYRQCSIQLT